ncbi:MAG TPA: MFS transporter [Candidatus Baltobacteraceae bacterium]|nr:MFS transporter [Candidatus Baltobacteraceae bacterium]
MTIPRLPRAVIPIYGTTLVDTLGYTLMIPLLPTVVRQYHASYVMAGALLSIPAFFSAVAAPIWGKVSDGIGRKPVIIAAQVLSLTGYLLLALSHSLWLVFLSRVISGCGGGSLGAVESYVADVTENDQREFAYSVYGAVFGLAFVIGPAASGALMHNGIALPFFLATALEAFNVVFTTLFLPLRKQSRRKQSGMRETIEAAAEPSVRRVLIRQFLFIFAIVVFLANFSLFVEKMLQISVASAAYMLAAAGAAGGVALLVVVTPLAKRVGDVWTSQIGLVAGVISYVLLIFARVQWLFVAALVIWAVGAAMAEPSLTTLLTKRAKASERGAIMGLSDSVNSIAMIAGPATGAAIVGSNAPLLGVLPAISVTAAFLLGLRSGKGARNGSVEPNRRRRTGQQQ